MCKISEQMIDDALGTQYSYITARAMVREILRLKSQLAKQKSSLQSMFEREKQFREKLKQVGQRERGLRDALEYAVGVIEDECNPKPNQEIYYFEAIEKGKQALQGSQQGEDTKPKEFARHIIRQYCWDMLEPDGGDIQEWAEKLGLIVPHVVTEDEADGDFEPGDNKYFFSDILEEQEQRP